MTKNNLDSKKREIDNLVVGARGGVIALILKISNTFLGFLNQVILARILGAGGVGEVILAITIVRLSAQIAKFGMEEVVMRFIPLYTDQKDESHVKGTIYFAIYFSLVFSIVFMVIILIFSKFIAVRIFHSDNLIKLLPVVAAAIPAWVLRDVIGGVLRGYKDALKALIPESLVSPFIRIAVFLILILDSASSLYAVIAFVTGEVLAVIVSIIFLRSRVKSLGPIQGKCEHRKVLDVAHTIIFTSMSILLYTQADIWILGMYTSTETVGIYGIAAKLVLLIYFPMVAFSAVIPPIISSIHASGNIDELRKMVSESTRWILSMATPVVLILLLEGKYILKYFYGPEFSSGYTVLVVLTAGQMIRAFAGLLAILFQMTGQHKIYMKVNIFGGILNIILNIILVPSYGMLGAAAATAFCLSMIDIVCVFIIYKRLAVLTLARGLRFDIVFISVVTIIYLVLSYNNLNASYHFLLFIALGVYLGKSIVNHDIPWKLLIKKYS